MKAIVVLLAAAFCAGVAAVVGVLLWQEHEQTLQRATLNSSALAMVLEAHTARTFQAVDVTLANIADTLALAPALRKNDPKFQVLLTERARALAPYVRAIYVIGPDGWIIHDSDYPATPNVSLADRPYFIAHRDDPALERGLSHPVLSRSGTGWFVAVSRRIRVDGSFKGVAVAAVEPQYFQALYRRIGLGEDDVIALYHRDGVLIARYPGGDEHIGRSFAKFAIFSEHLPRAESGSYATDEGVLPFRRLVSYQAVDGQPLVVAVAEDLAGILKPWRDAAIAAALAMLALLLLAALLVMQFLRHQRLRELAGQRAAQAEKLEALGHLTGGIAHDFNNLLHVMSSSLALIAGRAPQAQKTEALGVAQRALARGSSLIAQLSAFAKRRPLRIVPADLNARMSAVAPMLRHAAGPGVQIETRPATHLAPCLVDETELEVALVNLVVNARDAMAGRGRVVLRSHDAGEHVCLAVEDDGAGMPEEVRRRAMDPYYTTKGESGTGLGLAQVYGFMRQIGGEVRIESEPGSGTTVRLLFAKITKH